MKHLHPPPPSARPVVSQAADAPRRRAADIAHDLARSGGSCRRTLVEYLGLRRLVRPRR